MTEKPTGTRMVLHSAADLIAIEDELAKISAELRAMRVEMTDAEIDSVPLQSGTLKMHINKAKACVPALQAALKRHVIATDVDRTRNRMQSKAESRSKK